MFAALHAARAPKHFLDDKNVPTSAANQNAFSAVALASNFLRGGSSDPMQAVPRQGGAMVCESQLYICVY